MFTHISNNPQNINLAIDFSSQTKKVFIIMFFVKKTDYILTCKVFGMFLFASLQVLVSGKKSVPKYIIPTMAINSSWMRFYT